MASLLTSLFRWDSVVSAPVRTYHLPAELKQVVRSAQSIREDAADESDVLEAWISLGSSFMFVVSAISPSCFIRRISRQNGKYQGFQAQRSFFWIRTRRRHQQICTHIAFACIPLSFMLISFCRLLMMKVLITSHSKRCWNERMGSFLVRNKTCVLYTIIYIILQIHLENIHSMTIPSLVLPLD